MRIQCCGSEIEVLLKLRDAETIFEYFIDSVSSNVCLSIDKQDGQLQPAYFAPSHFCEEWF